MGKQSNRELREWGTVGGRLLGGLEDACISVRIHGQLFKGKYLEMHTEMEE